MRKFIIPVVVGAVVATAAPGVASAAQDKQPTVCEKAYNARQAVINKHGKRAPGRNICRFGVKFSSGRVTTATFDQKKRYLFQLRKLDSPAVQPVLPKQSPAGTLSVSSTLLPYPGPNGTRWAIPWYIVACESGGSWTAYNPSGAAGPYQIMPMHGRSWPANPADHHAIAARLWNGGAGASHWVCA